MDPQGKVEGAHAVVAGRIEELRRLEACERALAEALMTYARECEGGDTILHLVERHRLCATLLAERLVQMGGKPDEDAEDAWIMGDPRERRTILFAEEAALRTYHDHMIDMDPTTISLMRDRLLPVHREILEALTGEGGYMEQSLEYG